MDDMNKKLSIRFKEIGFKNKSTKFYFLSKSKKLYKTNEIKYKNRISTLTLKEINYYLKYYSKYFKIYKKNNKWVLDKTIFKIFFLNQRKRKYFSEYSTLVNTDYQRQIDLKGELLYFLIISDFINIEDINN